MDNDAMVYATGQGRLCPGCGKPFTGCECRRRKRGEAQAGGPVRVRRETKGHGGKTVTVIEGLPLSVDVMEELARELKHAFGCGGSVKDGTVIIQGDRCNEVIAQLTNRGFAGVKKSGG